MKTDPNLPGESPASRFGIWLATIAGAALLYTLASLAAMLADRIGAGL